MLDSHAPVASQVKCLPLLEIHLVDQPLAEKGLEVKINNFTFSFHVDRCSM